MLLAIEAMWQLRCVPWEPGIIADAINLVLSRRGLKVGVARKMTALQEPDWQACTVACYRTWVHTYIVRILHALRGCPFAAK